MVAIVYFVHVKSVSLYVLGFFPRLLGGKGQGYTFVYGVGVIGIGANNSGWVATFISLNF